MSRRKIDFLRNYYMSDNGREIMGAPKRIAEINSVPKIITDFRGRMSKLTRDSRGSTQDYRGSLREVSGITKDYYRRK